MDNLQPYPAYKDSGMPWLGELPAHWEARRLKTVCRFAYGDSLPDSVRESGPVPVFGSNGKVGQHTEANTLAPCLVIGRKGSFGKANYSSSPVFAIDTTFYIDERYTDADLRWLYYTLSWARLDTVSRDSAVPGLGREEAYQQVLPVPPSSEQHAIARFLDHIDRRINRYIRAKRKLISLLNEQKQAIIHRAVTRGLDPDVPLKPSGVEWLGEIPAHWEVRRIGRLAKVGNGSTPLRSNSGYWHEGTYPWLNSASVNREKITGSDQFVTELALKECHLPLVQAGSVLVAITGQGKTRGTAALLAIEATINQHMAYITPNTSVITGGFLQLFLTGAYRELRRISEDSGSTKGALTCEDVKAFKVAVPPLSEQKRLIDAVREQLRDTERMIEHASCQIDLIREYRTRLIADVVTGKLDVRSVALPEEDEEEAEELIDEESLDEEGEELDAWEDVEDGED